MPALAKFDTPEEYNDTANLFLGKEYVYLLTEMAERSHRTREALLRYLLDMHAGDVGMEPVGYAPGARIC